MRFPSLHNHVSDSEWKVRVDLAACYRLVARYGWNDLIYNHITARVPGDDEHYLINPFGLSYSEVTASCLCKIDADGNVIFKPEGDFEISYAGFVIHSAIHTARPDIRCILHTHTPAGMAVSAMECGLLPLNQTSLRFHGRIAYHDYEGPSIDLDERQRLVRDLGEHDAMVMRNHGLITCGRSVAEAFNMMYWLERSCVTQVQAMASGAKLVLPPPEVSARTAELYRPGVRRVYGEIEWPAMLRDLDREDPSYRT